MSQQHPAGQHGPSASTNGNGPRPVGIGRRIGRLQSRLDGAPATVHPTTQASTPGVSTGADEARITELETQVRQFAQGCNDLLFCIEEVLGHFEELDTRHQQVLDRFEQIETGQQHVLNRVEQLETGQQRVLETCHQVIWQTQLDVLVNTVSERQSSVRIHLTLKFEWGSMQYAIDRNRIIEAGRCPTIESLREVIDELAEGVVQAPWERNGCLIQLEDLETQITYYRGADADAYQDWCIKRVCCGSKEKLDICATIQVVTAEEMQRIADAALAAVWEDDDDFLGSVKLRWSVFGGERTRIFY